MASLKNKYSFILIILVVVALVCLSLSIYFSNFNNDIISKNAQALVDNNEQAVEIVKSEYYNRDVDDPNASLNYALLTPEDDNEISSKLIGNNITANVYSVASYFAQSNDLISYIDIHNMLYIRDHELDEDYSAYHFLSNDFDIVEWEDYSTFPVSVIGHTPESNDEIIISSLLADEILTNGIKLYAKDNYYYPQTYNDILNNYYHFGSSSKIKIVGIIDYDMSYYDALKNVSALTIPEEYQELSHKLCNNTEVMYNKIYVNKNFIDNMNSTSNKIDAHNTSYRIIKKGLLVMENTKKGFLNLLNDFRYDGKLVIKSSYSDKIRPEEINSYNFTLISKIFFIIFIILTIGLIVAFNKKKISNKYRSNKNPDLTFNSNIKI